MAKKLSDIKDVTAVQFPGNPTIVRVENGKVTRVYSNMDDLQKDFGDNPEIVTVTRPKSQGTPFRYGDSQEVQGFINGFMVPYASAEEYFKTEKAENFNDLDVRDPSLRQMDSVINTLFEAAAISAVGSIDIPENISDFYSFLKANVVYEAPDGQVLVGEDAIRELVKDDYAEFREKEINRYKKEYGLTEEQAALRFEQEKKTAKNNYDNTLIDLKLNLKDIEEDRVTSLERLAQKEGRIISDAELQLGRMTDDLVQTEGDVRENYAQRGLFSRDESQKGQQYQEISRYRQAFDRAKTDLETQKQRNIEDIIKQREDIERGVTRSQRDIGTAINRAKQEYKGMYGDKGYVPTQEDLRKQLSDIGYNKGLESLNESYDLQQERDVNNLINENLGIQQEIDTTARSDFLVPRYS